VIVDGIVAFFLTALTYVMALFPAFSPPSLLGSTSMCGGEARTFAACSADQVGEKLSVIQAWVNVDLLVGVLTVCMAVLLAMAGLRITIWIYEHVPGKSE
jgi:hypothetical protein